MYVCVRVSLASSLTHKPERCDKSPKIDYTLTTCHHLFKCKRYRLLLLCELQSDCVEAQTLSSKAFACSNTVRTSEKPGAVLEKNITTRQVAVCIFFCFFLFFNDNSPMLPMYLTRL